MPDRSRKKKRTDLNELAKSITEEATGEEPTEEELTEKLEDPEYSGKDIVGGCSRSQRWVAVGHKDGLKDREAQRKATTKKERSEEPEDSGKDPAAVALGRKGGLKGA